MQVVEPRMHPNHTFILSSSVKGTSGKGHFLIALKAALTGAEDRGGVTQKTYSGRGLHWWNILVIPSAALRSSSQSPTERGGV